MDPERDSAPGPRPAYPEWLRPAGIVAIIAVGILVIGAIVGHALVAGGNAKNPTQVVSRLQPAPLGTVMRVLDAGVPKPMTLHGIGSLHAGITATAYGVVDDVQTAGGRFRAPDGGRLVAFRLADWTCATEPCAHWRSLQPVVSVDGTDETLPSAGNTFAVVLPPGGVDVVLKVDADGYPQSLDLLDGEPGPANIALYDEPALVARTLLGNTLTLTEQSSIALSDGAGPGHNLYYRDATIEYAELRFFLNGQTPSAPGKAFLVINAYYNYEGQSAKYVFGPTEATFVTKDGARYPGTDLDPSPQTALLGFEVPADVRSGELVLGGRTDKTSTAGTPYTTTLQTMSVPISVPGGSGG